jgi:LysM repeat protein
MPRIHSVLSFGAVLCAALSPVATAQEPAAGSIQEELRALRQLIEQQSKQIDALTAQVTKLGGEMERRGLASGAPMPAETGPTAESAAPAARVVTPPGASSNVHIVVKGDSLDKIAKTHNTTIAELQKLNKITDPKKLQIGQQIMLPAAPAANPEKKEGQ